MQLIILSWKLLTKRKFQQIAPTHLSDSDFKDFMKDVRSYKQPYSF